MNPSYSISKPCSEDWGKMTPEQQGRHCQVCCKTVVDFSKKSDSEIVDFLKTNAEKKVCGRFRSEQLIPLPELRKTKPNNRYRVFFAALMFVFGGMLFTSCSSTKPHEPELMGDVAYVPEPENHLMGDTIIPNNPDTLKKVNVEKKPKCTKDTTEIEYYKMGDVAFDPNDTIR